MSYQPQGLSQVEFKDDEDAIEDGQMQVDFVDNDALLEDLNGFDTLPMSVPRRRAGRPWRKLCCVLVPILAAVGTGMYFLFRPQTGGTTSSSSSSSSSTAYITSLKAPPADLPAKCTSASDECRMVCEASECCDFPSNLELSCLAGNEDKCLTYHQYCSILDGDGKAVPSNTTIPRAPSNLPTICTTDAVATVDGFQECLEACQAATCCYEDEPNVPTCSNSECVDYAPCLILKATDYVHTDIPTLISDHCSNLDDVSNRAQCRITCSNALCCFYKDENNCPHPDTSFCDQYQVCNDLESDVTVVADSTEITMICSSYHTSMCEFICERGACCFASKGCASADIKCEDYATCARLYGDSQDDDIKGGGGGEGGEEENTNSNQSGQPQSETSNNQSNGGNGSNGATNTNDDLVGGIVYKADVDDACLDFDPGAEGQEDALCPKLCADVGCCFLESGCTTKISCSIYKECDVIHAHNSNGGGSGGGDGGGISSLNATADEIEEACNNDEEEVIASPDGSTLCSALCKAFECCFKDCTLPSGVDCTVGTGCSSVYNGKQSTTGNTESTGGSNEATSGSNTNTSDGGSTGSTSSGQTDDQTAIYEACADKDEELVQMPDQPSLCKQLCNKYKCCHPTNDCIPDGVDCTKGKDCDILWNEPSVDDEGESGTPTEGQSLHDTIMAACEVSTSKQNCKSLCVDGQCCFESQNCEPPSDVVCSDYKGCLVIYAVDGEGDVTTTTPTQGTNDGDTSYPNDYSAEDIAAACTGNAVSSMCTTMCSPSACCFTESSTSCTVSCEKYAACTKVWGR